MSDRKGVLPVFEARRPVLDIEYIYEALKESFMIGEFEPGQRITLPLLAEAFGTSQMPIREAINRLVVARALESMPRRSVKVPEATTQRLDDLLPLRLMLEGEATRLAVHVEGQPLAKALTRINAGMDEAVNSGDRKHYLKLNQQFHFTIYRSCKNDDLVDVIESLWMRYGPLISTVRSEILSSTGHRHHNAVIEAIDSNDPTSAAEALCADIRDAAISIRRKISDS